MPIDEFVFQGMDAPLIKKADVIKERVAFALSLRMAVVDDKNDDAARL